MTGALAPPHSPPSSCELLCCGGLRTDYIITSRGEARLMEMGGNALYAAAGAKVWLERVAILARVGESYPLGWLDDLREYGFDVRGIRRVPGPCATMFIPRPARMIRIATNRSPSLQKTSSSTLRRAIVPSTPDSPLPTPDIRDYKEEVGSRCSACTSPPAAFARSVICPKQRDGMACVSSAPILANVRCNRH
jgi:hypothetical protein